jgi:hypothetical protein
LITISSSKLKQEAESNGYIHMPSAMFVMADLFKAGKEAGLFPEKTTLHYDVIL